ncbi:MAG: electron transport complex subunit RsxC [Zoogloeaceae bacterium]|nr:electron transport complex subunit RsxC [Zoogloeaceae bacterium]
MLAVATLPAWLQRSLIRWGVHPDDHKRPVADLPVERLPLPARLFLPLQQHVGAPARPVVKIGDPVLKGQLLAESAANISAPVHASTSGRIVDITTYPAPHPSGLEQPVMVLEPDGEDRWIDTSPPTDPFSLPPAEIGRIVSAAGVVGMGGATFPSAVKLALGLRVQVEILIVNGGECEPYLSCDDRLMRDDAEGVVDGIRLALHAIGAQEARVGIENNKPEAIAAMQQAAAPFPEVRIMPVPAQYPMGSDKQLIQVLTGREVPFDGRAADAGVLVHNVGTCHAIHQAVRLGRPLVERLVTVSGGAVERPRNLVAPIGATAQDLFDYCGGLASAPARVIMGGPMMGNPLATTASPVIKGTSGLLALTQEEVGEDDRAGPCIRCASCVSACPMNLLPLEMAAHIRSDDPDGAFHLGLNDCIGCGCCSYVCPSAIPLSHYFSYAKGALAANERSKLKSESIKKLTAARLERQEREAREKAEAAARRKAEREAAKARAAAQANAVTTKAATVDANA